MRKEMQAEQRMTLQVELSNKITQNMQLIEDLKLKEGKMWERHEADLLFKLQCQEWSMFLLKYMTLLFASFFMYLIGEQKGKDVLGYLWSPKAASMIN